MASPICAIVGYGPGVGHGIAQAFASQGFQLALLSRHPDNHRELVDGLVAQGVITKAFAADASQSASIESAIRLVASTLGEPEVLIYNVSTVRPGPLGSVTSEDMLADLGVIVGGALTAANAVIPGMKARGHGTIMFTGSHWGEVPNPAFATASIGKAALHHLARLVALDGQGSGVHSVLLIIKGLVHAETTDNPKRIGEALLNAYQQPQSPEYSEILFETQPEP
jgi:NAD(P)-dependent dehydrogenase (short-subunit alcohol dehydrogenase family)